MKNYNVYKQVLFLLLLFYMVSCLVSCVAVENVFSDELKDSLNDSDLVNETLDDLVDYSVDNSIDVSKIVFSTEDLEPVFQIVIGDKLHNYYDNENSLLSLCDFIGDNPCPEKFWLISPFYEPKEFLLRDFDTTEPIELSALAQTMTFKPIKVRKSTTGWKLGPFVSFKYADDDWSHIYNWSTEQILKVYSPPRGVGLVGLDTEEPISSSLFNYLNDQSLAVSTDSKMIAYIDKGFVVTKDLVTEEFDKWALTKDPGSQSFQTFSTEFLSWSPNGRYLVGSNYAYYDHYLAKVWVLDVHSGKIKKFNTLNSHAFLDPFWSPNSDQVVLSEYFRPYSEDFHGQWILLDIPSLKVISIAGRDNYDTNYNFNWDNGSLELSAKLTNPIQAYDPYNNIIQDKSFFETLNRAQEGAVIISGVKISPDERYVAVLKTKPFTDNLVSVTVELSDLRLFDKV